MKSFVCSLCLGGILGGALYLDSRSLTFKTGKITVDKKIQKFGFTAERNKGYFLEANTLPCCRNPYAKRRSV